MSFALLALKTLFGNGKNPRRANPGHADEACMRSPRNTVI